ncbi:MAG: nuclear transport factor 2 family protein [Cyclobacteriaceae bacterium]|nr:nuclear transport factor 2 family protein [Cyclobacteriaceae bacterium]
MEKQEKQKIEALLSEYQKSLNTSDAKLAQSLYTKDGIFMPTEAPSGIGSEGILKSYEYVFSQIQLNIEFFIEEIQIQGNMAFAVTQFKRNNTSSCHKQHHVPERQTENFSSLKK